MSISLVAGLGNLGREYASTRHNLGWVLIDAFARQNGLVWQYQSQFEADVARWDRPGEKPCYFLKPLTYMNESGRSVAAFVRYYKIPVEDIAALYDEFNIDLGLMKISTSGSAGGHNGVASLLNTIGDGFIRYRLGIGPKTTPQMDIKDFVLGKFTPSQQTLITQTLDYYLKGLNLLLTSGVDQAMNTFNRRENHEPDQP